MTDKVQKIREEVEKLYNQSLADENRQADRGLERAASVSYGKSKACKELLSFIDSLQEEPASGLDNGDMPIERWKQAVKAASNQRNYRSSKGLTETRDDYFVDGVQWADEHPKEEPVSEDLEEAAEMFIDSLIPTEVDTVTPFAAEYVIGLLNKAIKLGANWQKEQIIKRLCNHANIDQMVEKFEDKYKPEKVLDTEYYKRGIFDTIKAIKED